jgi:site-specific recombinase XerD
MVQEEMMDTLQRRALELLCHLRTLSGKLAQSTASQEATLQQTPRELWRAALQNAEATLADLENGPTTDNVRLILRWLYANKRLALNSVHNMLDDVVVLLEYVGDRPLVEALACSSSEDIGCVKASGRYFTTLRSLYHFATGTARWSELPRTLRHRKSADLAARAALAPGDIEKLIDRVVEQSAGLGQYPGTGITVSQFLIALLMICAIMGLRISEALTLRLGDIWITDRLTVIVPNGKGGKSRVIELSEDVGGAPCWVLDFLQAIWLARLDEEHGNLQSSFFTGRLFAEPTGKPCDHKVVYQRVLRFLKSVGFQEGTHTFRRFFANSLRAQGIPLLSIVNLLGHATIGTAPQNYIQVYPGLQRKQLHQWLASQNRVKINSYVILAQFAEAQGISREGAHKLLVKTQQEGLEIRHDGRRTTPLRLLDAINILKNRIRKVQQTFKNGELPS